MPSGTMTGASVPGIGPRLLLEKQQTGKVILWGLSPPKVCDMLFPFGIQLWFLHKCVGW